MMQKFLFGLFLFSTTLSWGQIGGTLNTSSELFQTNYTNPAKAPSSSLHIGLPASSAAISIINTGFSYYGLPKTGSEIPRFLNRLGRLNYLTNNIELDIFSFGIRLKRGYFSMAIREKLMWRLSYPGDLLRFAVEGNGSNLLGKRTSLDGLGFDLNHYREISFNYSRDFNHKLRVGARGKLLFGYENVRTINTELGITTENGEYDNYGIIIDGKAHIVSSGVASLAGAPTQFNPLDYQALGKNKGFAFDFGIDYQVSEYASFSASVVDIGGIQYTEDVRNLETDNISFAFNGVDIFQFISNSDSASQAQDALMDSLETAFDLQETTDGYFAPLNGKLFVGGEFKLFKQNAMGVFATSEFIKGRLKPSISMYYKTQLFPGLSMTANYAIANRSVTNIGAGLIGNIGIVQIYAVSDNLIGIALPARTKTVDIRFGVNLRFGNGLKNVREVSNRKAEKAILLLD